MDTEVQNPPALPCKEVHYGDYAKGTDDSYTFHTGMTLRDYFAGQAVVGILSGGFADTIPYSESELETEVSSIAYRIADAMLKGRGEANDG